MIVIIVLSVIAAGAIGISVWLVFQRMTDKKVLDSIIPCKLLVNFEVAKNHDIVIVDLSRYNKDQLVGLTIQMPMYEYVTTDITLINQKVLFKNAVLYKNKKGEFMFKIDTETVF